MGFLDLFKKKPKPGPVAATIESYRVADSVGEVRLASGTVLRFGRTACKDFEPAVGVKVHVESVGPHPLGGERVQSMVRDPSDTEYERRVAARDSQAAPPSPLPPPAPLPKRLIDADLLKRLGNVALAGAMVRGGNDPQLIHLAISLDAEEKISEHPAMAFRFDVERMGPDHWRLLAGIDDPVAFCRFWLDLKLPELPLLDPAALQAGHAPNLPMTVSKPPEHTRNPLARSAFLLAWRVDGGIDAPNKENPLELDVTVMGVELSRTGFSYTPAGIPDDHWVLLKCHRGDAGFFIALELSTGAAEIFPRRFDAGSYQLALDSLSTFA